MFALIVMLAAAVPALAQSTLCASGASTGGEDSSTSGVSVAPTSALYNFSCTAGALTIGLDQNTGSGLVKWHTSAPGYPTGLTLGELQGLNAPVITDPAGYQPYYDIAFKASDGDAAALGATSGDTITLLEFQPSTVSGGDLGMSANSTLFNVYDYNTQTYLLGGQSDAHPLSYWTSSTYSSLGTDAIYALDIGIGSATYGSCSDCSVSMTVNYLEINPPVSTPEGGSGSLYLLLAGAVCFGAMVLTRRLGSASAQAN